MNLFSITDRNRSTRKCAVTKFSSKPPLNKGMREFIDLMEKVAPLSNANFRRWFDGSKVVDENGQPMVMYHGSSKVFDAFDTSKIKANETDAPFNGFWFSEDPETSPAFHDPTNIIPVYLSIRNPADWTVWRKVAREVREDHRGDGWESGKFHADSRTTQDEVRYRLIRMGYDGILFDGRPDIDREALGRDRTFSYRDARGHKYRLDWETKPEVRWGKTTHRYTVLVANNGEKDIKEVTDDTYGIGMIVGILDILDEKPDFSGFNAKDRTGVIRFKANGQDRMLTIRREEREAETDDWVPTGKNYDSLELYHEGEIGHITGYEDIDDFLRFQKVVWVCFHPTQIKSIYNRGTWDPNNPNISEGR